MLAALAIYAVTGGADFGGGIWDMLASGPRKVQQRRTIALAIGPIWEANHVWLILVVVLCFVSYPSAFATIGIALHIPLTIMLVGIVLRGTAFVFRAYDSRSDEVQRRWSAVFSAASVWSPFMLGCCIGAMASGEIRVEGTTVSGGYLAPWTGAFPFSVGAFVLSLFALLAATYLTLESDDPGLIEDFRYRAMAAWAASGACAWMTLWTARAGAPLLYEGLWQSPWALPFQLMVGLLSGAVLWAVTRRRYRWARGLCIALVWAVVWGWGMAQYPWLVVPDLTISNTVAPRDALVPVLTVLALGAIPLAGSFWALYAVFKSAPANQIYRD